MKLPLCHVIAFSIALRNRKTPTVAEYFVVKYTPYGFLPSCYRHELVIHNDETNKLKMLQIVSISCDGNLFFTEVQGHLLYVKLHSSRIIGKG